MLIKPNEKCMRKKIRPVSEEKRNKFSLRFSRICTFVLISSFCCALSAVNSFSQTNNMTVKLENEKVDKLFSEIEKSTDYVILYKKGIADNKKVSINSENETVESILSKVLPSLHLTYYINGNQIVVVEQPAKANDIQQAQNPKIKVSGVISDRKGETLPGVAIVEKGNVTNGTSSDIDGKFSLEVKPNATLVLSYLGYQSVEVKAEETMNIIMDEEDTMLEDVVVVAYGKQKKANLTGSVASVSSQDLAGRANSDILTSVQGQIPGVNIIARPGSTPTINFRGRGNLGTSSPLYVIDGAVSDATVFNALDPSNIESISFLKDAASSAIYGARAAFGVVLVTTKGGDLKKAKLEVSYNGFLSIKEATYKPKILNSYWYAMLENEAIFNENPKATPKYSAEILEMYKNQTNPDYYPNTNWYDLVTNDYAPITRHAITISGGDKVRHSTTLSYMYNENFTEQQNNRFNVFSNVNADVYDWLTVRTGVKLIKSDTDRDNGGVSYMRLLTTPSTYVARHSDGSYGSVGNGTEASNVDMERNPLRIFNEGGWYKSASNRVITDLAVDIKPIENLVLTGSLNYYFSDSKTKTYTANMPALKSFIMDKEYPSTIQNSKLEYDWRESTQLLSSFLANYSLDLGNHNLQFLGGTTYEQTNYQRSLSWRTNFPTNGMTDINGGSDAAGNVGAKGGSYEYRLMSYFGRINYNFADRYLFEANLRTDGSSRFPDGHRWGIFPSFSGAWRVSQESFMQDIDWLDNLKIRASWGQLGNINNVGNYDYFQTYALGNYYNFDDVIVTGVNESKPANTTLTWENTTITDIGVDLDLFNGKFGLVFDWYNKVTRDILLSYSVPNEIGAANPSGNVGRVDNTGIELGLSHNNKIGDFRYGVNFNLAYNKNKIKDLGASGTIYEDPWIKAVGHSVGNYYIYLTDGLLTQEDIDSGKALSFDKTKPNAGDIKYVDVNDDGKLDGNDRVIKYSDVPNFTYGIGLNADYKNFDIAIFGQGVTGTKVRFENEQAWAFFDFASPREYHLKRWTVDNPNPKADYPRIYPRTSSNSKHNQYLSDFWLFDSDYFRVKNITLGYSFPRSAIRNLSLSKLRLYLAVDNPFTIRGDKRMEDFDPESPSGRGQMVNGTRSFTFGLDITF